MLRSMTGFGTATSSRDGASFLVEVRTVNNRYLKQHVRLPDQLQGLEPAIDAVVSSVLARGSIHVSVKFADASAAAAASINTEAVAAYLAQLGEIAGNGVSVSVDAASLLSLPGALVQDTGADLLARVRDDVLALTQKACDGVMEMRVREGVSIEADVRGQLEVISDHLSQIADRSGEVVDAYQSRLRQRMETLLADSGCEVRDEDLLREVAVFAERSDVAEEVSRLRSHVGQFEDLVGGDGGEPIGRTLDFLAQEMLREANTIGSKCLDGDMSRRVVEIKGAIDRIKEQVQNVE